MESVDASAIAEVAVVSNIVENSASSQITVSGIRADDMAARLKYAGFPTEKINIIPQIKKALDYSIDQTEPYEESQLVIMPTYTALLEMQHLLRGKKK